MRVHIIEDDEDLTSSASASSPDASAVGGHRAHPTSARPVSPTPSGQEEEGDGSAVTTTTTTTTHLDAQRSFLLFFKLCVLYLVRTKRTALQRRLRVLVLRCTRENRQTTKDDDDDAPLRVVLRREMRTLLGEFHWHQIHRLLRGYCTTKKIVLKQQG